MSKKPIRVSLYGGAVGRNAVGDVAIVYGILESLRRHFKNLEVKNLEVNIFSHSSDLILNEPECIVFDQNKMNILKEAYLIYTSNIVICAMAVFSFRYTIRRLFMFALAYILGKRVIVWAVEFSKIKGLKHLMAIKFLIRFTDMITVRDSKSFEIIKKLAPKKQIELTADAAFVLEPKEENTALAKALLRNCGLNLSMPVVAICPRTLITNLWHPFSENQIKNFIDELAKLTESLSEANIQVVFIQMSPDCPDDDMIVIEEIKQRIYNQKNIFILQWQENLAKIVIEVFQNMDAVLAVRMHSAILAVIANTPIIGVSYEPKVRYFFEMLAMEHYLYSVDSFNSQQCFEQINVLISHSESVKQHIALQYKSLRERSFQNSILLL